MSFVSYSQNLEDVMLWRALRHIQNGFYIDVGAWDSRLDSVTLAFYRRGWHGVNVEPDPTAAERLAQARPSDTTLACALSNTVGTLPFYDVQASGLSTLDPRIAARHRTAGHVVVEHTVPVQTLAQLCTAHAPLDIHFLKIDVEGHEGQVLAGADFDRFRPWIVVVEATVPNDPTPAHELWDPILTAARYALVYEDGLNRFYVSEERRDELEPAFAIPPNVFDDYVSDAAIRKAIEAQGAGAVVESLQPLLDERAAAQAQANAAIVASESSARNAESLDAALREAQAERDASRLAVDASQQQTAAADARAAQAAEALDATLREAQAERDAGLLAVEALAAQAAELDAALQQSRLDALAARRNAALARADAMQAAAEPQQAPPPAVWHEPGSAPLGTRDITTRQRVYYDASLIVAFGHETPVGLVRTEHYLAEFMARMPAIDLRFVLFDRDLRAFRALTRPEARLVRTILFHRYDDDASAPELAWYDLAAETAPASPLRFAQSLALPNLDPAPVPLPPHQPLTPALLLRRVNTAAMLPGHHFRTMVDRYGSALLPVRPQHGTARRLVTRMVRGTGIGLARGIHGMVRPITWALRDAAGALDRAAQPDARLLPPRPPPPPAPFKLDMVAEDTVGRAAVDDTPKDWLTLPALDEEPALPPGATRFPRGSVLVCAGNAWDYLDYDALHRLCRTGGVRFIPVVYDVIAMELPFSTPSPPDIYQRHWVEIGHTADCLLAISKFTARQYDEFIARPNDLAPRISHAYLPSFLLARRDEIGEAPVPALTGRRFVVYCSTIETRKNHQLLVHLWDRLRKVVSPDQLPILVFVGKWGWGTETVRLLTERNYRLRSHMKVLDRVSDAELIWLYRHARFTVFPSLSEGYGLAAAESLSFGTPAIVADCPALVEATEGLMPALDPLDIAAWHTKLLSLIQDDALLQELRNAAARYRGPAYDDFAAALCALVLAPSLAGANTEAPACPAA